MEGILGDTTIKYGYVLERHCSASAEGYRRTEETNWRIQNGETGGRQEIE